MAFFNCAHFSCDKCNKQMNKNVKIWIGLNIVIFKKRIIIL